MSHNLKQPDDLLVRRICDLRQQPGGSRMAVGYERITSQDDALRGVSQSVYDQSPICTEEIETVLARGSEVEILPFKVLGRQIPHPRLTELHNEPLRLADPEANADEVARNVVERLDAALQGK